VEVAGKVVAVGKATVEGDLGDRSIGFFQKVGCFFESFLEKVLDWGVSIVLFEDADEMAAGHAGSPSELVDGNGFGGVFVHPDDGLGEFGQVADLIVLLSAGIESGEINDLFQEYRQDLGLVTGVFFHVFPFHLACAFDDEGEFFGG